MKVFIRNGLTYFKMFKFMMFVLTCFSEVRITPKMVDHQVEVNQTICRKK